MQIGQYVFLRMEFAYFRMGNAIILKKGGQGDKNGIDQNKYMAPPAKTHPFGLPIKASASP